MAGIDISCQYDFIQVGWILVPSMKNQTTLTATDDACADCSPTGAEVEFQRAVRAIASKWKIEILCALARGTLRFGELRRSLPGITQHMLTSKLRELENDGLVIRTAYAEIPLRVEYELSEAASALGPIFDALMDWSLEHARIFRDQTSG